MRISNGKLYYLIDGKYTEIENISLDVSKVGTAGRAQDKKTGMFINTTFDMIEININRGLYEELDSLKPKENIYLRLDDGIAYYDGKFYVDDKNTHNGKSYICFGLNPEEYITITPKASGVKSGVQDVQIEGTSIVDVDTGVANITTLTTKADFKTAVEEFTKEITSLNQYCDDLDATKLDVISYVELTGKSGTLTDEQRATLLSGSPTLNFIDKDGMLFKCVFYSSGKKAVYSIAGESKIHVITVTLPAGTWALVTYELAQPYTAGDGITIKNNVISATGGSGSGVSQDYVDTQDQAILATATERIDEESSARQTADATLKTSITEESTRATNSEALLARNMSSLDSFLQTETEERTEMDATLSESILNETDKRTAADTTLQTNIDNEIVARTTEDVKLQANIDNCEKSANKVTEISSSSTDTQYPSAKAVYTYIESLNANTTKY